MPVYFTTTISRNISEMLFSQDGSMTVTVSKTEDGVPMGTESFHIDPVTAGATLLDIMPTSGLTIREQMVVSVLNYLITNSLIPGTFSPT